VIVAVAYTALRKARGNPRPRRRAVFLGFLSSAPEKNRASRLVAQPSDDLRPAIDEGELAMKVESDIRDNPAMSQFEMPLGDGALAVVYYKVEDGRVVLLHTEVPQELSGLGYGSRLAHGVFEALRRDGKRVIAKCSFMSSYAARHPEYGALLDG
jgi:predicted GNAT family acetyltransferase